MKKTFGHFLPGVAAAVLLLQAGAVQAGTTYTYTATEPSTPGDWSHDFTFPQFNPALGSLDAIHLTASLELTASATLSNTVKSSKVFWYQAGSLLSVNLPGAPSLLEESPLGPRVHYSLPGFGEATYQAFSTQAVVEVTLSGADLAPFIGAGTVDLWGQAQAQSLLSDLDGGGNKIDVNLSTTSGAVLTLEYLDAPVPEPSVGALLAVALGGLAWKRRPGK